MKQLQDILEGMFDNDFGVDSSSMLPFVKEFKQRDGWVTYIGGNKTHVNFGKQYSILKFGKNKQETKELGFKKIKSPDKDYLLYDGNLIIFPKKSRDDSLFIYPNKFKLNWVSGTPLKTKYYEGNDPNRILLIRDELILQYTEIQPSNTDDIIVYDVPDDVIESLLKLLTIPYSK